MRYDDASQAGSTANDSAPVARPDVDALAPGSFGPASGNAITGAGTVTGSSGADSVGDSPGKIVEVHGAGGATGTGANGNFQATGQYGVLSMDAEGNFSYVRNAGTPDGVQDVFGYTLADADGQTSSTTLAIDIAKVGAAQAGIIPGIVNLPPGVQLSDIRVSGRDLIINMPDGTQMVIPGGAVFVPQLVIGDVQVPPSNLAALLVESEPQPAVGQLSSSGGNFATDVPPLDPGVPLGDLIPPTEFGFPLPIFEEVGGFIDREPEAGEAFVQLDDDDIPNRGGNPGGTGDDAGSPNATASGFLPGSDGDGTLEWDLLTSGAPSGFTYVDGPNGSVLVQQVQNGSTVTVLTITIDPDTGAFTVTENNPVRHAVGDNENNSVFVINYSVTDDDGDSAIGTLTINVDDDTPVVTVNAGPDANVLLTTDDAQSIPGDGDPDTSVTSANFGGVFTGTSVSPGADGAGPGTSSTYALAVTGSSSGLTSHGVAINLYLIGGVVVGSTSATQAGVTAGNTVFTVSTTNTGVVTLTQFLQIDHPIGQDPTPTGTPFADQLISMADGLVTLTRSETVVDNDGDSVTGSATVNIGANLRFTDDGPTISLADRGEPTLEVDETNLAANDTDSFAANFSADFNADGPAAAGGGITYALSISAGSTGLIDTLSQQAVVLSVVNGQVVGTAGAGGPVVFVVSVDASGNVTLDQQRAVMHTPNSGPDQTTTLAADNLVILTATATDFDGDTASQALPIGFNLIFHDDAPSLSGNTVAGTVDEDGVPAGIPGGPGDVAGEATVATGSVSTLFNSGADQPLTFSLLGDTSGLPALTSNGVAVTYQVVGNTLTASAGGNTVFTFVLNANGSFTFTLVDQLDHPTLNGQAGDNTENDLTIALGSIIRATDADGDFVNASANGLVITVDDDTPTASGNQVTGTVDEDGVPGGIAGGTGDVAGEATVATGSVSTLFNSGADQPLSFSLLTGTGGLPALTSNGVAVTYQVVGNTLTASAGGNTVFTFVLNANGTWTFTLVDQLDHPTLNGQAGDNTENDLSIDLSSIIQATDADGDSVSANANGLVITVDDDTPTNNANVVTLQVDEDAVPGGIAGGPNDGPGTLASDSGSIAGLFNSGADQPLTLSMSTNTSGLPALTSNGVAITYQVVGNTLTASAGGNTVFTLVLNPGTGNATFTLVDQIDHATLNGQAGDNTENNLIIDFSSMFQATDADGDSISLDAGSFLVDVDDDTPTTTANQVTGTVDEDGVPGGIAGGTGDVAGTATVATGSVSTLFNSGADAPLTFSLANNLGSLPALTSAGVQVTYQVVGNTLTASAGGNTVFTFTLNSNGTWTFTLVDQIDHPTLNGQAGDNTENDLNIDLSSLVQATDADGDTISAAANALVILVDDDTPVAANDTDTVGAIGTTATGNVITDAAPGDAGDSDNGADSVGADAPGTIVDLVSVGNPGATDTNPSPTVFSIAGSFGVLVMESNGNYTYTRTGGPGGAVDVFTYTLQDADGDITTATLTITAADVTPVATTAIATVDDDALTGGNPGGSGDANANAGESPLSASEATWNGLLGGSGGDAPTQFLFQTSLTGTTASVGQETVTYTISGAGPAGFGTVLTATITGGARNGTVLFTVTITDPATGAYTVQLLDNVIHPTLNGLAGDNTENNVSVNINYQLRDSDGDISAAPGVLTIDFDDDTPVTTASQSLGTVDEDGVPGGIAGGTGDVAGQDVVATGSVSALFSAGADSPLTFSLLTGTGSLPALTSNGVTVTYAVVGNTLTASAGGNTVFTLVLQSNGDWTFTLVDQIDHPTLNGAAGDNTENDLTLDLSSVISATDADGDSVTAAANGLVITVDDDTPTTTVNQVTGTVDEEGLTGGIAGGTGDVAGQDVVASGSVTTLFNSGADAPLSYSLLTNTSGLPALTSGGTTVTYSVVGNLLTASAGGNTVFTLSLNPTTGAWTFTLVRPLDHATGNNENDITLDLSSIVSATDADGDSITAAPNALVITVDDDSPINFTPQDLTDDTTATPTVEDDSIINDGNGLETNPLNDTNNDGVGENFIGADGFAATNGLVFTVGTHVNGEQLENTSGDPLTSGGDPIYMVGFGTGTLTGFLESGATPGYQAGQDTTVVFTITLNQGSGFGSNSTYTIDFNLPIDNGSGVTFDNLTSAAAGNVDVRGVGADDPGTLVDLLLTASTNGANSTINTDSDSIGSGNQSMDEGETVRIDFVTNLEDDPTDNLATFPSGFSYDGHVGTNSLLQAIPQVQGSQTETVAFRVYALNTTVTDAGSPDDTPGNGFSDASIVPIIRVTIDGFDVGETPVTVNVGAVGVWTAIAYGVYARLETDGSVTFTGVQQGDQYGIETAAANDFNAFAVTSLPAGVGPVGNVSSTNSFDLGIFAIGQVDLGDPIDLAFDVTATDRDGDTSTGTIDVTLSPVPQSQAALNTKSTVQVSESLQTTTNSNPVLMAAFAAAGLAASDSLAAQGMQDFNAIALQPDSGFAFQAQSFTGMALDSSVSHFALNSMLGQMDSSMQIDVATQRYLADQDAQVRPMLDEFAAGNDGSAMLQLLQGTDSPIMHASFGGAGAVTAAGISMPGADMLLAGGLMNVVPSADGQHNAVVGQVLVDALNGGGTGPNIETLVNAISIGQHSVIDALASHGDVFVPNGDMGIFAGFTGPLEMHMEQMVMHVDAAPAQV